MILKYTILIVNIFCKKIIRAPNDTLLERKKREHQMTLILPINNNENLEV